MSATDFNSMKKSVAEKDARITINGFISTSQVEKISLEYAAAKLKKRGNDIVIMYEITIDPAIPCTAYADIESISFHPREKEILFNMGSTFQIDSIDPDPSNPEIQRIKLTARDFNLTLLDEMKAKVKQSSQATLSILLVRYLIELGEDRVSKRYLNQLIESKQLENDLNLVVVYNCLGTIHSRQALYGEALEYYRKALNTQARLQFSNNNALAEIFNNIGQTHLGLDQLDEAKQNLEEGIRIQKREPKYSQQHLASLCCNMGQVAYAQHDLDEAENNFNQAYDLYNHNTKISHDALEKRLLKADLCIAFGHLKSVKNHNDPTEADEKFNEALKIYECILPPSHPKVAEAHIDIVCEYTGNKNYPAVIAYFSKHLQPLLQDYESKHTTSQLDLANLYANIGACFAHQQKFDEAMKIWKKGMEHEQKAFLDQLLSSARVSKVQLYIRLIESAYHAALDYYSKIIDANKEYLAILYTKMHIYDRVIDTLRGQNSFLLAQVCITLDSFKKSMVVYKRIVETSKDPDVTLLIGLLLGMLTMKTSPYNEEPAKELERIETLLRSKITDNEAIRLRMIINDYLAETYLKMKKCTEARQCFQISFELKQRLYSSYHPSLIRNYELIASCYFEQKEYKNAVQYYEKAIDIQLENMPSGHVDIRSNYFLLGDCYCRMDKIELATEFYDRAQALGDLEIEEENETELDVKALLRMYTNLSEVFAKQNDFSLAKIHQQTKIDTLKEILPTFIVAIIEDEEAVSITFDQLKKVFQSRLGLSDGNKFPLFLQNFVYIHHSLGRVLLQADKYTYDEKDASDVYEQAIELQLKLTLFDTNEEHDLADRYEELSNTYRKRYSSMKETIRDNLVKALEETTNIDHQRSLEFRLGNLYFEEENYTEADRYWKNALKKVKDDPVAIKTIIEKLIEKNQINLSNAEENSDEDEQGVEETNENEEDHEEHPKSESRAQSVKSQRRLSTKSVNEKEKSEEIAQAYLDLGDDDAAMKYFKRYISKLEAILKPSWPEIELRNEQLPMIKMFHSLVKESIDSALPSTWNEDSDQAIWINLLQAYMKLFNIALKMTDSFDQLTKAMLATFHIGKKLYDLPNHLTTLFDRLFQDNLDEVRWNEFLDLFSPVESTNILIKIAEFHLSEENQSNALNIYRILQENIESDQVLKNVINYGMLKLLELYVVADENYRQNIMSIDIGTPSIPIFDRIILCRLIIAFMNELDDETASSAFQKQLLSLQKEEWKMIDLKSTSGIGQTLTKFDDTTLACWYWQDLQALYNEILPNSIINRLYSVDSTFQEMYRAVQDINNDLFDNISSLAKTYAKMSDYEKNDNCKDDAYQSLKKAIIIADKMPLLAEKTIEWKMNVNALTDT